MLASYVIVSVCCTRQRFKHVPWPELLQRSMLDRSEACCVTLAQCTYAHTQYLVNAFPNHCLEACVLVCVHVFPCVYLYAHAKIYLSTLGFVLAFFHLYLCVAFVRHVCVIVFVSVSLCGSCLCVCLCCVCVCALLCGACRCFYCLLIDACCLPMYMTHPTHTTHTHTHTHTHNTHAPHTASHSFTFRCMAVHH